MRRNHRPELGSVAGMIGQHGRSAACGVRRPDGAAAGHRACHTAAENESFGLEELRKPRGIFRCHRKAKSIRHTGSVKETSMEQPHWWHPWKAG